MGCLMIEREELEIGKTYWYSDVYLLREYPKEVTVTDIRGNVVRFDAYVSNEKFAEIRPIISSLCNTEDEAIEQFAVTLNDGQMHFIENDKKLHDYIHDALENKPHLFL